jgi:hypothetical protein
MVEKSRIFMYSINNLTSDAVLRPTLRHWNESMCWIRDSQSGGYEGLYVLGYNAM